MLVQRLSSYCLKPISGTIFKTYLINELIQIIFSILCIIADIYRYRYMQISLTLVPLIFFLSRLSPCPTWTRGTSIVLCFTT
jgi:hypothetical protein